MTRPSRLLRGLLVVHGVITLAAAVVLNVFPAAIPGTVGIPLPETQYLLSYFLAAAELAIGLLSLGAARLRDRAALALVFTVFIVFHLATAVLEVVHLARAGTSPVLVANIVVRIVAAALFLAARIHLGRQPGPE